MLNTTESKQHEKRVFKLKSNKGQYVLKNSDQHRNSDDIDLSDCECYGV